MLRVEYREGLYLPDLDLWMDADGPRERCVISHGHSDHIAEHKAIIATPETARIFQHRRGEAQMETLVYGERRDYGQFALTFFPAGHCLGSAQVLIEAMGEPSSCLAIRWSWNQPSESRSIVFRRTW
jgi:putative mRNA 3-end processing factor